MTPEEYEAAMVQVARTLDYLQEWSALLSRQNLELNSLLMAQANANLAEYRDSGIVPHNIEALQVRAVMACQTHEMELFRAKWGVPHE